jgi:uncharacterized SAM-binding protein YcdF (DUF218 family)
VNDVVIRRAAVRWLGRPLEVADRGGVADAIVILGAPLAAGGGLSEVGRERVDAGVALWRAEAAPRLCVTGGPSRGGRTEADAMAEAVLAWGVPEDALRIERQARTTAENASRVAALLCPEGARRVWLVSQPFHLRRARWLFRRVGLEAWGWRIGDSVQDRDPERALGWVVREYAAWARALALPRPRR